MPLAQVLHVPAPNEHANAQIVDSGVSRFADLNGIMGFTGTAEEADYFAMDPEARAADRKRGDTGGARFFASFFANHTHP